MNTPACHSVVAARRNFAQAETLITAIAAQAASADDTQSALLALLDETFVPILGKHDFYLLLAQAAFRTGGGLTFLLYQRCWQLVAASSASPQHGRNGLGPRAAMLIFSR